MGRVGPGRRLAPGGRVCPVHGRQPRPTVRGLKGGDFLITHTCCMCMYTYNHTPILTPLHQITLRIHVTDRALHHHAWYKKTFKNYPAGRKAIIPYWL